MSTLPASADMTRVRAERASASGWIAAMVVPATAILLLAIVVVALFTPAWVHFALSASGATASVGSATVAYQLSDRTIGELLFGPATFSFAGPGGGPFYTADEAAHLRDVRTVLFGLLVLAVVSALVLSLALARRGGDPATWRAIARGAALLAIVLVVLGVVAALAFGIAFELFHRILFPGGNWAFPVDSNLIALYPLTFWQLTSAALGVLGIGLGMLTWLVARRRARREALA